MKGFSLNKFIIMLVALFMLNACTILNNNIFRGSKYLNLGLDGTDSDTSGEGELILLRGKS